MTLTSHGYTFVAKGTVEAFTPEANREAQVYQHLKPLQGTYVPVYLGSVDLGRPYYLDLRVYIVRMLFMSWGGIALKGESLSDLDRATREEVLAMECRLVTSGILHGDIRPANVLRDPNTNKLMLIDFAHSDVKT
jgi:serine/threonine protein kinase